MKKSMISGTPAKWIDISRPLTPGIPVWPGDQPMRFDQSTEGKLLVSAYASSCHAGTHMETAKHVDPTARGIESIPVDVLVGPADVVKVEAHRDVIVPNDLPVGWKPRANRVLLRTDSHPLGCPIEDGFCGLSPDLVHWLADLNVELVGIDTPSVDPFSSVDLPAHSALAHRGMTWIEGLWMEGVTPGRYVVVALPLPLVEAEAAPARVLLHPTFEPSVFD